MDLNAEANFKLGGEFQLVVSRNGQVVQETDWFSNLILDQGKDYIGLSGASSLADFLGYAQVGTGTTTAISSQTQLDAWAAATARTSATQWSNSGSPNYNLVCTFTYAFNQGAVIGNMSEVGIGRQAATGQLFSRARIVDTGGNPTTLALTSFDQLIVNYKLTISPDLTNTSSSVTLAGTTYPYTAYNTNAGSGGGNNYSPVTTNQPAFSVRLNSTALTQATFYAAGTPLSASVLTDSSVPGSTGSASVADIGESTYSYSAGTYTGVTTLLVNTSRGNLTGGIQIMVAYLWFAGAQFFVLYYFSTPIPKTSANTLRLVMSVNWN